MTLEEYINPKSDNNIVITEKTTADEYIKLIDKYNSKIDTYEFTKNPEHNFESIRIISSAIFEISKDISALLKENHLFSAGSLACSLFDAIIQLGAIDLFYNTNGKDYIEFAFVEQLHSLNMTPKWREDTLLRMQKYNCERFFKKLKNKTTLTQKDILNPKCYYDKWYKNISPNLKELSHKVFPHLSSILNNTIDMSAFVEDNDNILYENYMTLCGYKHFSPFISGNNFNNFNNFHRTSLDTNKLTIACCTYLALLITAKIFAKRERI